MFAISDEALLDSLIDLQEKLLDIKEDNVETLFGAIAGILDGRPDSLAAYLSESVWQACLIKPDNSDTLCHLIQTVQASEDPRVAALKSKILDVPKLQKQHYRLVLRLFQCGLIEASRLEKMANNRMFHFYFAPELGYSGASCHPMLSELTYQSGARGRPFRPKCTIEELAKDDWKLHKELREKGKSDDPVVIAIRNDDVETFSHLFGDIGSPGAQIPYYPYDVEDLPYRDLRLADFAALCGAVNVFKFLLLHKPTLTDTTGTSAVISGSTDILRILDDAGVSFNSWWCDFAACYQRFDILHWLVCEKNLEMSLSTEFAAMGTIALLTDLPDPPRGISAWIVERFPWLEVL